VLESILTAGEKSWRIIFWKKQTTTICMFWQINVSRTSLPPKTIPWAEASAYLDKRAAGNTLSSAASTVCPLTMARIELMPEALDDLDRIVNHLVQSKAVNIPKKIAEIQQAISVLQTSPRIGHAISNDKRELPSAKDVMDMLLCTATLRTLIAYLC
jgi:plasmid stabilization system protein ParE